jgi:hypothetical protein
MGNYLSTKKEKTVKGIENYVNCDDIHKLDHIIRVFNDSRVNSQLSAYVNDLDSDNFVFDHDFYLNVKFDDKFKDKYLRHSLSICLSFLDDEYKRLSHTMKKDPSGFIDNLVKPICYKLTFTSNNYTFFRHLHVNCVKIQRWYRKNKQIDEK